MAASAGATSSELQCGCQVVGVGFDADRIIAGQHGLTVAVDIGENREDGRAAVSRDDARPDGRRSQLGQQRPCPCQRAPLPGGLDLHGGDQFMGGMAKRIASSGRSAAR